MRHDTFNEQISLWFDHELSPAEMTQLQLHLAGCVECQQTYLTLQRVDQFMHGAAASLVAPLPGFTARFESRLVQHQARGGHIWLGLGVLLLGTLFLFIVTGVVVGAVVSNGINLMDLALLNSGLVALIQTANTLGVWVNLVALFVKVGLITMSHPFFWGFVLAAVALTWVWLRLLKSVQQQVSVTIKLFI